MKYFINPKGFKNNVVFAKANKFGMWFVKQDGASNRVPISTVTKANDTVQKGIWEEITPEDARKLLILDLSDMRREWEFLTFSQVASVMEEIKRLEKAIPNEQGSISLCLRSDMSWCVMMEVWGREIAMITKGEPQFCLCERNICKGEMRIVSDINKIIPKDLP